MKRKDQPLKVGLVSLGCAKNLVDSEVMVGSLLQSGCEIVNDASSADVLILNTCSFIDAAQEESVDAILEAGAARENQNPNQAIVVSGCLPQRFREELPKLLPEVDAFIGVDQVAQIRPLIDQARSLRAEKLQSPPAESRPRKIVLKKIQALDAANPSHEHHHDVQPAPIQFVTKPLVEVSARPTYVPDYQTPRFRLTPQHFAYVKIAEGCNHPCSFCIIPRMRGSHRSRQQQDVAQEVRGLVAEGVKEINLISQDSTYYGLDLRSERNGSIAAPDKFTKATKELKAGATTLCTLLKELNNIPGDFWIRLLYTHPAHWTDELIQTIANCRKVARYIDMPLQHIHGVMLERMRRETSQQYIEELIKRIRAGIPGITLRTTFIVGFPGETDEHFQTLLEFIRTTKFDRLGIFTYSAEEGTRAGKMEQQIPEQVKKQRQRAAMREQLKISRKLMEAKIGSNLRVLTEREASAKELQNGISSWEHGLLRGGRSIEMTGKYIVSRAEGDAPDIDGRVYVRGKLPLSEFATVRVIGATDYDLIAEPA